MKKIIVFLLLSCPSLLAEVPLKQSTATQVVMKFVSATDGVTAMTALTVTNFDCNIVKFADSGIAATALTITASGGSNDSAHLADGIYSLELTATDTGTAGRLFLHCQCATAMPYEHWFQVVPAASYAMNYEGDVSTIDGLLETALSTVGSPTAWAYKLNNLDDTISGIFNQLLSSHLVDGSFGAALQPVRVGTAQAGAAGSITLDASASATDDFYNQKRISIVSGTGAGQSAIIVDYVGSTKVATTQCEGTSGSWRTNPSTDSVFVISTRNR